MLLLGYYAAQVSAGPAVETDFDLLQSEILTGSQASVTFSSLGDYASKYQHLQLRIVTRTSATVSWADEMRLTFNSDTGSNYASHRLIGTGSAVESGANTSQSAIRDILIAGSGNSSSSSVYAPVVIDILDPFSSSKNTTTRSASGITSIGSQVRLTSGFWNNTASVTTINFTSQNSGNFLSGSRFSLYGLRK